MKIFLAFSFRDEDKLLVSYLDQLVQSHSVQVVTGERLGGEQLTPAVKARIDQCQALVGLLTRRDPKQAGGWTTHQWVLDEMAYAREHGKRAIALIEDGVDSGGMYQPNEHIPLKRETLAEALIGLSETIGVWRRETGRTLKVQILPTGVAKKAGADNENIRCRHRLWLGGKYTEWREVTPVPEGGGTFVFIEGVQEDHLVQLQLQEQKKKWQSTATSQWVMVHLSPGAGQ